MAKIAGGALRGLGTALVQRTVNEREDKLRAEDRAHDDALELRRQAFEWASQGRSMAHESGERGKDRDHESGQRQADREHSDSQVADVVPTEGGNDRIVTRGGQTKETPFRSRGLGGRSSGGADEPLTAAEQRIIDQVAAPFTTTGDDGEPNVDWDGVTQKLTELGRTDLAQYISRLQEGEETTGSPEIDEYLDASSRRGGDPLDPVIERETRERTGQPMRGPRRGSAQGPSAAADGTEQNPHRVDTQEQFDALPVGAYFIDTADGQLYRKK